MSDGEQARDPAEGIHEAPPSAPTTEETSEGGGSGGGRSWPVRILAGMSFVSGGLLLLLGLTGMFADDVSGMRGFFYVVGAGIVLWFATGLWDRRGWAWKLYFGSMAYGLILVALLLGLLAARMAVLGTHPTLLDRTVEAFGAGFTGITLYGYLLAVREEFRGTDRLGPLLRWLPGAS